MTRKLSFEACLAVCPLIAILRGVKPDEVLDIARALVREGFGIIEVPLNSPAPFDSIARLVDVLGDAAMIGAGTVTTTDEVERLAAIGARLVLSPHFDAAVVGASRRAGMACVPGVMTPTEAFGALATGASALKFFPMELIDAKGVKALRAVLPKAARVIGVGGIDEANMRELFAAGCNGFGLGSSLYKPGMSADAVGARARVLLSAARQV